MRRGDPMRSKITLTLLALAAVLACAILASFLAGRYPVPPDVALAVMASKLMHIDPFWKPELETVILKIRLPRIVAAAGIGAALSASGAAYQGMFRNPLVSPDILGVSAGAGFGAALGILLGWPAATIQAAAFGFGLLAVAAAYLAASWSSGGGDNTLAIVLAGVVTGSVFTSLISLLKFAADPTNVLPAITFWLMGSLASISARDLYFAAAPACAGMLVLFLYRWKLNVLSLGEEEAQALGVNVRRTRLIVIASATLVTAAGVAIAGIIGLVGLVVPYLARLLVGPNHAFVLPASMLLGATYLIAADDLARSLLVAELPLGILTSLTGAPFFLYLLVNTRKAWN
jgi:iron complex transport system permease protein